MNKKNIKNINLEALEEFLAEIGEIEYKDTIQIIEEKNLEEYYDSIEEGKEENEKVRRMREGGLTFNIAGCEITLYPDDTYSCSFDKMEETLGMDVIDIVDSLIAKTTTNKNKYISCFYENQEELTYINNKYLFNKFLSIAVKKVKEQITKDSAIKALVNGKLIEKGYKVSRLTKHNPEDVVDLVADAFKDTLMTRYKKDEKVDVEDINNSVYYGIEKTNNRYLDDSRRYYSIEHVDYDHYYDFDSLKTIFADIFGEESEEYNEFLNCVAKCTKKSEETIEEYINKNIGYCIAKTEEEPDENLESKQYSPLFETYLVSVLAIEKDMALHISKNSKNKISLKQAYNTLPESQKQLIAEEVWSNYPKQNAFVEDIISIFKDVCKGKEGTYSEAQIRNFLENISMQTTVNFMKSHDFEKGAFETFYSQSDEEFADDYVKRGR